MNYLEEILRLSQTKAINVPEGGYFNVIFLLKDFMCQDGVPLDNLAEKFGVEKGEMVPAGTAPRLAHARSETYWLTVCFRI